MASGRIRVEVAYAAPERQSLIGLEVAEGATVREAIASSGIENAHPEIDIVSARVGIFGKIAQLDAVLEEGDRVEIYRSLQADPKDARRRKAGTGAAQSRKKKI